MGGGCGVLVGRNILLGATLVPLLVGASGNLATMEPEVEPHSNAVNGHGRCRVTMTQACRVPWLGISVPWMSECGY